MLEASGRPEFSATAYGTAGAPGQISAAKRTQNTVVYSVKARIFNGLRGVGTVYYPNWNADLPMPLYTFFEEYDFSGKTIIPFVTHGGSGFSGTIRTIQNLEPDAAVIEAGLSISRNSVPNAQADVKSWTDSLLAD